MSGSRRNFAGLEGFIWFVGVVEDRMDPEELGRVRVRIYGWHISDKNKLKTDILPWAQVLFPNNLSNGVHTPKEGDWVLGFFLDGFEGQDPCILGVLPGIPGTKPDSSIGFSDPNGKYPNRINEPTTNRLSRAREDGTIIETRRRNLKSGVKSVDSGIGGQTWDEPPPPFAPKYPFNNAHESESGHAFELDDTEGKERVHLAHKIGSFFEMDYNGNRLEKVIKDRYTVVMGTDHLSVEGNCNITVNGNCNIKVEGRFNVEASEINMSSKGDVRIKAGNRLRTESGNTTDIKSNAAMKIGSGGKMNIKGSRTTIQGARINLKGKIANKVRVPPHRCKKGAIGKIRSANPNATSPINTGLVRPN